MPIQKMLRLKQVLEATGLGPTALKESVKRGGFPRPVRVGRRAIAWPQNEIEAWQKRCIAARDSAIPSDRSSST
jgi:prophage regulatory protein